MAEEIQATDTGVQNQAPINVETNVHDTEGASSPPVEKMIPQSQVTKIAAREAREAAEKARAEATAHFEQERARLMQGQHAETANGHSQTLGGIQQQSPAELERAIRETAHRMSREAMAQQIERDFLQKVNSEKDADPEFAELYSALNIENHPDLILMVNGMDNTAKILKDLAANPAKFSNVLMLAKSGAPELARRELMKLSASIKANLDAQKQPVADAPLGQLKPSNIGADNGDMSVSDYRMMFKG